MSGYRHFIKKIRTASFLRGFFLLSSSLVAASVMAEGSLVLGAERADAYLPLLEGKRVGLIVNQTSTVGDVHLLDSLLADGVEVKAVFAPEHGFRGKADAGEKVNDSLDEKTNTPIVSLYGCKDCYAPSKEDSENIDVFVFEMQDVGTRFYTYISTMHYAMESCAAYGKEMIILDRPNPNGDYIAGPILDQAKHQSFIGMDPIPVVHGLTIGELAKMINGEGWLKDGAQCKLTVVPMENYTHDTVYEPPIKPSPNLPNYHAIRWYPSLVLFENAADNLNAFSVGRGTDIPFEFIGYPDAELQNHPLLKARYKTPVTKTPAKGQVQGEKEVYGFDLRDEAAPQFSPRDFILWVGIMREKDPNFPIDPDMIGKRYGNDDLYDALQSADFSKEGWLEEIVSDLEAKAAADLEVYKVIREKYVLYP